MNMDRDSTVQPNMSLAQQQPQPRRLTMEPNHGNNHRRSMRWGKQSSRNWGKVVLQEKYYPEKQEPPENGEQHGDVSESSTENEPLLRTCSHESDDGYAKRKLKKKLKKLKKQNKAATQIQRIARGWFARLQYRVLVLQDRLEKIERRTAYEIESIQDNLEHKKERLWEKYSKKYLSGSESLAELRHTVAANKKAVQKLRDENTFLREEYDTIKQGMKDMRQKNRQLNLETKKAEIHNKLVRQKIENMECTQQRLQESCKELRAQIDSVKRSIKEYNGLTLREQGVKDKIQKSLALIVGAVEDRSESRKVLVRVEHYYLRLDDKLKEQKAALAAELSKKDDSTAGTCLSAESVGAWVAG